MNIYAEPTGRTDYEKFKWIIAEIDHLINKYVACWESEFKTWYIKTERFLIHKFGENSFEHKTNSGTRIAYEYAVKKGKTIINVSDY
jgi:hypothetical protein